MRGVSEDTPRLVTSPLTLTSPRVTGRGIKAYWAIAAYLPSLHLLMS